MTARQLTLLAPPEPGVVIDLTVDHGEVFTRRWVVEFILDLVGYTAEGDLGALRAVEPSCGGGAFLIPMVERLVASARSHNHELADCTEAIRAFDLLPGNVELSRKTVASVLVADGGLDDDVATELAESWVTNADFLLHDVEVFDGAIDFVVGNPPYIRLEDVPADRMSRYRDRCRTMRGRADIYVGFIEAGLQMLRDGGALGFIVADRWMHNQYGADLRELISSGFAVDTVVAMHDVDAFDAPVSAYPAVTVIRRSAQVRPLIAATNSGFAEDDAKGLLRFASDTRRTISRKHYEAARLDNWYNGRESWPSGSPSRLALIAELERNHPPLEDPRTGTRVGIGLATGADHVFMTRDPDLVETDRLLPLLLAKDTVDGTANWSGTYLVNPWEDGRLVDLTEYPRLAAHLKEHDAAVRGRHVAQKNPAGWYRTIDRVEPGLAEQQKLLLPDIKAHPHPVLDDGRYYPHHNLYFITSTGWDLEVLGGLLLSDIVDLFVGTYCVKMRGGTYRFQAQYLRRIRVPDLEVVGSPDRRSLIRAFQTRDTAFASSIARKLYGVSR